MKDIEILDEIFNNREFNVRFTHEGVYTIESNIHEGFIGEKINAVLEKTKLYLSQIRGSQKGQEMLLLDLNVVDTHFGFYGYRKDKARGCCYICGKQTDVCKHEYVRATEGIRNCNVCDYHEFCSRCKKETHGTDMCVGDLCSKCYDEVNKE